MFYFGLLLIGFTLYIHLQFKTLFDSKTSVGIHYFNATIFTCLVFYLIDGVFHYFTSFESSMDYLLQTSQFDLPLTFLAYVSITILLHATVFFIIQVQNNKGTRFA